jgi:translation initiation factor 5
LGGFERYFGVTHPELTPSVPKVLMALYQEDVLDEQVLNYWSTHTSKKYVDKDVSKKIRAAAAPFLKVSYSRNASLVCIPTDFFTETVVGGGRG